MYNQHFPLSSIFYFLSTSLIRSCTFWSLNENNIINKERRRERKRDVIDSLLYHFYAFPFFLFTFSLYSYPILPVINIKFLVNPAPVTVLFSLPLLSLSLPLHLLLLFSSAFSSLSFCGSLSSLHHIMSQAKWRRRREKLREVKNTNKLLHERRGGNREESWMDEEERERNRMIGEDGRRNERKIEDCNIQQQRRRRGRQ